MIRTSALLLMLALAAVPVRAGEDPDPSVPAFASIKKDVEELRRDPDKKRFRHHYEKLVVRLQAIANTHKEGSRADDAAYVAAQLLEELYYVSRVPADKEAAVNAFIACADRFPSTNLADDALLAAARLTPDRALSERLLERVVAMGRAADLKAAAASQLAQLRKTPAPAPAQAASSAMASPDVKAALDKIAHPELGGAPTAPARLAAVEVLPEAPPPGTPARKVIVIKHEKVGGDSVVSLRVSAEVGVTRGEVPKEDGGPRRLFYDLAPARLGQRNIQPIEVNDGVVARVRAGQYDTDVVRLVVELVGDREPVLSVKRKPFEIVLSAPLPQPPIDALAGALSPPMPAPAPVAPPDPKEVKARFEDGRPGGVSISQQLGLKVHRVVIDAGHGGADTGAIGPTGVKEKDITLQLAKRVRDKLKAEMPDVEVILTRHDDKTLALQDRTNTANAAAADLFISIHCNASPMRRVRGVETYTLNITHDRYSMRLAARENAEAGEGSISDLDYILADLAMKSNVDDSVRLGRSVQRNVMKSLRTRWSETPDLGLKSALFYVLMGNRMPSILVETSFLSNRTEEQRLNSAAYQDSIADGIVDGVRGFVEERAAFYEEKKP